MFAVLIVVAVALAYSNSLHGPFIWDDQLTVVVNKQIRSTRLPEIFSPERELPVAGRPLVNAAFALNHALGGLDVTGYHLVNVGFHLACALLLFAFARRALQLPAVPQSIQESAANIAFAIAVVWAVHPLNTEAVNYITQRTELMMAFFYLLTIYASTRTIKVRATGEPRRLIWGEPLWLAVAVLACAAGMACKESMATAPVVVVLLDATLVFGSLPAAVRARWKAYLALAATWGVLAFLMASGPRVNSAGLESGVTPWTYLLNQPEVITRYLWLAVWPRDLVSLYGWPEKHISLLHVWPYALCIVSLFVVTVVALVKRPPLGLLGAWFFITLAPASSVVPIATEVGAERRMYVPLMAIVALLVLLLWRVVARAELLRLGTRTAKVRATWWIAVAVVVVALGVTTVARNRDYGSLLRLAQTTFDRRPNDVGRHALGVALVDAGRVDEGIAQLELATATEPRTYYDLGNIYLQQKRQDDALRAFEHFVQKQPMLLEVVSARMTMGRIYGQKNQWDAAAEQYETALRLAPGSGAARGMLSVALVNSGLALVTGGNLKAALEAFVRAAALNPASREAHHNLAVGYFEAGDMRRSAEHARQALALDPDNATVRETLRDAEAALQRGGPPAPR